MLLKPTLKLAIKEKPVPKFYVYYDEWTGEILDITSRPLSNSKHPHIVTEDGTAKSLMLGHVNPNKYIIADLTSGMTLIPKNDAIRIKKAEDVLSLIPEIGQTVSVDVNLIFYINDYLLEINLSQDLIFKMTGNRFRKKFNTENNVNQSKFEFYLIAENNPLYLMEIIEVDPIVLFNNGYIMVDLSHLKTKIGMRELQVLTKRIFRDYGIKFKQNYTSVDYTAKKSLRRHTTRVLSNSYEDWTTFSVSPSTEGWIFRCNFNDPFEHKIYEDLKIYLVDDDPNSLLDKIVLPFNKLGKDKEFIIKTKVDPLSCNMLLGEEGRNVTFKLEEIKYVKSGKY
jgi:hypothetical protein